MIFEKVFIFRPNNAICLKVKIFLFKFIWQKFGISLKITISIKYLWKWVLFHSWLGFPNFLFHADIFIALSWYSISVQNPVFSGSCLCLSGENRQTAQPHGCWVKEKLYRAGGLNPSLISWAYTKGKAWGACNHGLISLTRTVSSGKAQELHASVKTSHWLTLWDHLCPIVYAQVSRSGIQLMLPLFLNLVYKHSFFKKVLLQCLCIIELTWFLLFSIHLAWGFYEHFRLKATDSSTRMWVMECHLSRNRPCGGK